MSIPKIQPYTRPAEAQGPANRVNWTVAPARAVLLIHDMQEYFLDFYNRALEPVPSLTAQILRLRQACDAAGIPVVYTAQPQKQSPKDRGLLEDFWGPGLTAAPERAGIVQELEPRPGDVVLTKWRYSAFVRTDLRERMESWGRDQLIVCGVYAHIGCQLTCADAFMRDIQPFLVGDAVADFSLERHEQALEYTAQRCGVVIQAEKILEALAPGVPSTLEALRGQVAALLEIPSGQLGVHDDLLLTGLDSIRLMSLSERWRHAGVDFTALAEVPTLEHWWTLLREGNQ